MEIKDIIFDLCSVGGVSGSEGPVIQVVKKYFEQYSDVSLDSNGNVYAVIDSKSSNKTILLDAHIDRIGLMVTGIDDNGFVKVDKCGGIDVRTLQDTEFFPQNYPFLTGVVCCMPPHLSDGNEDKSTPITKTWIDFGLDKESISKYISMGDVLTFKSKPRMLLGDKIASACLDDRCGVAALLKVAEILSHAKDNLDYKVVFLLSSQEETFGTGAKTGAFNVEADEAIAVDVSFASQPDISGEYSSIGLQKGPMICISPILNKTMVNSLIELAKQNNIPYQLEPISSATGTNADSISVCKSGVKTAVISIPQRYMHTPNEVISIKDVEYTAQLIADYVLSGGAVYD
ncbi:MAG: M20/M25/M40 family metallo-hydrolase [Ruminococcus sp.]|nr:M20/M25/M40 family metallo-hydrolase [Ruminococcus sp.]